MEDRDLIGRALDRIHNPMQVGGEYNLFKQPDFRKKPLQHKSMRLKVPTRLNAMGLAPKELVDCYVNNLICKEGEVLFSIDLPTEIKVSYDSTEDQVKLPVQNSVVQHTIMLLSEILGCDYRNFSVEFKRAASYRHCGLGSTGSLMAATAVSINEMFGSPIQKQYLCKYLSQNYGEEIDADISKLMPVQCIGGSLVNSMYGGAIKIISGESQLIFAGKMPVDYHVYVLMPENYDQDSKEALSNESQIFQRFIDMDKKFRKKNSDGLIHTVLPALSENNNLIQAHGMFHANYSSEVAQLTKANFKLLGDFILDYKLNSGSLDAANEVHHSIPFKEVFMELVNSLYTQYDSCLTLSVSSAGPGIFVVCSEPMEDKIQQIIKGKGYTMLSCSVDNNPAQIIASKALEKENTKLELNLSN
ncbi:MAG: hypothetical protein ACKOXB_09270 [Flavobacteriales bacterium]